MQSKLRTHCMLNFPPPKIVFNNHLRDDPWHTLVTYTVSEIETQLRDSLKAQEACTFLVKYFALIDIVMVLFRKMSSQISASSMCLLQIFKCKFIIVFYDNGAQRNIKITYNNKRPHYRDF